jgi:hypothetical protein
VNEHSSFAWLCCDGPSRIFGNPNLTGDLLAQASSRDLNHDLSFSRTQSLETLSDVGQSTFILATDPITGQGKLDSVKKFLIAYGLCEEFNRTTFHRLYGHWNIAVPRNEDNREVFARSCEFALKFATTLPRQPHVQDKAAGAGGSDLRKSDTDANSNAFRPTDRSRRPNELRRSMSSSMIEMVEAASGIACRLGAGVPPKQVRVSI